MNFVFLMLRNRQIFVDMIWWKFYCLILEIHVSKHFIG